MEARAAPRSTAIRNLRKAMGAATAPMAEGSGPDRLHLQPHLRPVRLPSGRRGTHQQARRARLARPPIANVATRAATTAAVARALRPRPRRRRDTLALGRPPIALARHRRDAGRGFVASTVPRPPRRADRTGGGDLQITDKPPSRMAFPPPAAPEPKPRWRPRPRQASTRPPRGNPPSTNKASNGGTPLENTPPRRGPLAACNCCKRRLRSFSNVGGAGACGSVSRRLAGSMDRLRWSRGQFVWRFGGWSRVLASVVSTVQMYRPGRQATARNLFEIEIPAAASNALPRLARVLPMYFCGSAAYADGDGPKRSWRATRGAPSPFLFPRT